MFTVVQELREFYIAYKEFYQIDGGDKRIRFPRYIRYLLLRYDMRVARGRNERVSEVVCIGRDINKEMSSKKHFEEVLLK